eukprot:1144113-Pelagomonas_calceolata.AAC.1
MKAGSLELAKVCTSQTKGIHGLRIENYIGRGNSSYINQGKETGGAHLDGWLTTRRTHISLFASSYALNWWDSLTVTVSFSADWSTGNGKGRAMNRQKVSKEVPPIDNVSNFVKLRLYKGYKGKKPQSRRSTASLFINTREIMKENNRKSCYPERKKEKKKKSCVGRGNSSYIK